MSYKLIKQGVFSFLILILFTFNHTYAIDKIIKSKIDSLNTFYYNEIYINPQEALYYSDTMISLLYGLDYHVEYVNALLRKAYALEVLELSESADSLYLNAIEYSKKVNKDSALVSAYHFAGIYKIKTNELLKGSEYLNEAEKIALNNNLRNDILEVKKNKAIIHNQLSEYDKALIEYHEIFDISKEIGDSSNMSFSLEKIAYYYKILDQIEKAKEYYFEAINIYESNSNYSSMVRVLGNIGNMFNEIGELEESLKYYFDALQISKDRNLQKSQAAIYNNIGLIFKNMEKYKEALVNCRKSLQIKRQLNDPYIHYQLTSIAEIYLIRNNLDSAKYYIDWTNSLLEDNYKLSYEKNVFYLYYQYYSKLNDYEKSLQYYIGYSDLRDSLINRETNKKLAEMNIRFDTKQKEQENLILKERNIAQEEINRQQRMSFLIVSGLIAIIAATSYYRFINKRKSVKLLEEKNKQIESQHEELAKTYNELSINAKELSEANASKDKFFSIIAHDLKNPLHAIILSSDTLIEKYEVPNRDLHSLLVNIHQAGRHLSNLLENLLQWARTQTGRIQFEPTVIELKRMIDSNIGLFSQTASNKFIKISTKVPENIHVFADPNMLSSILRNLISNAIKFSNIGGNILIGILSKDDKIQIYVSDDGVGISREDLSKLFRIDVHHTTFGTKKEKGTGLGLLLCKEFVELNGGHIRAESELGKGTTIIFTVKKHK